MTRPSIIITANPFGYGPAGKAITIATELKKRLPSVNIFFLASNLCQEIMSMNGVHIVKINERDESELENFLIKIRNPYIISSQNRFIIKVAKKLNIPCAFLDGLAWFWKTIPDDHLIADIIFWLNYPGIEDKLLSNRNIHLVPSITMEPNRSIDKPVPILLHLGGCENPLTKSLPYNYLTLLVYLLNNLQHNQQIIITGGTKAISFMNLQLKNQKVITRTLKHDKFIDVLGSTNHFITTAGQTATMEAFALNIPTSFLLPTNLSQMALVKYLSSHKAASNSLLWQKYVSINSNLLDLNEKEALVILDSYAQQILSNTSKYIKLENDFVKLLTTIPDEVPQQKLLKGIGTNGSEKIVDILINNWKF